VTDELFTVHEVAGARILERVRATIDAECREENGEERILSERWW
jgi:hypothetical protein